MATSSVSSLNAVLNSWYVGATSANSSFADIAAAWESRSTSSASTAKTDSVTLSDNSQAKARLGEIDRSLVSVDSALRSARSLAELASRDNISDSFRSELQTQIKTYLAAVDTTVATKLDGALTYEASNGESSDSIAKVVDISTKSGAASAMSILDTAITDVKEGRKAVADELAGVVSGTTANATTSATYTAAQQSGLQAIDKNLKEMQSLAALASQSSISSDFRAQLQARATELVGEVEQVVTNTFGGNSPLDLGGAKSLASAIKLDSATNAQAAADSLVGIRQRLSNLQDEAASASSTAAKATSSAESELQQRLLEAKSQWEGNLLSTMMTSMQGSSGNSLTSLYTLLLS